MALEGGPLGLVHSEICCLSACGTLSYGTTSDSIHLLRICRILMPDSLHNLNQHLRLLMLKEGGFNGKAASFYDEKEYAEKMEEFYGKLDLVML